MRGFLAALIVSLAVANSSAACTMLHIPKPDELRFADTVVKAVLRNAEAGPDEQFRDHTFSSAFLVFEVLQTYRGPKKDTWRVIWRRGNADRVLSTENTPEVGGPRPLADPNREPYFGENGRYYYFHAGPRRAPSGGRSNGSILFIGEEYIVGIMPAEKQFSGQGCTTTGSFHACFPVREGGYHIELQAHFCGIGFPYAFPFSDVLETRVLDVLATLKVR